jgi:hypothetical protein
MQAMFYYSKFNHDISNWIISENTNTEMMFDGCTINNEYKPKCLQLNEAFDFDAVNKDKKFINAYNTLLEEKIKTVVYKILNQYKIGIKDKTFILSLPPASYKTNDDEIHLLV